ncbi:MAG: STAS domain-containing protein [Bacillota bacterium]
MLHLEWVSSDSVRRLRIQGELAAETVERFEAAAGAPPSGGRLVVDCQGLSFIDSTGTNALLLALLRWRRDGRSVELTNLADEIYEMFEWLGVFEALDAS